MSKIIGTPPSNKPATDIPNKVSDSAGDDSEFVLASLPSRLSTDLLQETLTRIRLDSRYAENLPYGKVRKGHPEGSVENHIAEVEQNVSEICALSRSLGTEIPQELIIELLIVTHVHDTFKGQSKKQARIEDPESHASLARAFLSEFSADDRLLSCVQYHDVPYSMYRNFKKFGDVNHERLSSLIGNVKDLHLFTLFQIADNTTKGKAPEQNATSSTEWFINQVSGQLIKSDYYLAIYRMLAERKATHN